MIQKPSKISEVSYETIGEKLVEYDALDFDDLLMKTVELFEQVPDVQQAYYEAITYILVDEFHDVNSVQYRLLRLLCAPPEHNLMVVADEDQSIYSWRGSNPEYIDKFRADFNPTELALDDHYRCSEKILRAAEEVISRNTERQKQHTLRTHKDAGRDIFHYTFDTPIAEARGIINVIQNLVTQRNYSYRDIAVFYRTHRLADVLEEQLLQAPLSNSNAFNRPIPLGREVAKVFWRISVSSSGNSHRIWNTQSIFLRPVSTISHGYACSGSHSVKTFHLWSF